MYWWGRRDLNSHGPGPRDPKSRSSASSDTSPLGSHILYCQRSDFASHRVLVITHKSGEWVAAAGHDEVRNANHPASFTSAGASGQRMRGSVLSLSALL